MIALVNKLTAIFDFKVFSSNIKSETIHILHTAILYVIIHLFTFINLSSSFLQNITYYKNIHALQRHRLTLVNLANTSQFFCEVPIPPFHRSVLDHTYFHYVLPILIPLNDLISLPLYVPNDLYAVPVLLL